MLVFCLVLGYLLRCFCDCCRPCRDGSKPPSEDESASRAATASPGRDRGDETNNESDDDDLPPPSAECFENRILVEYSVANELLPYSEWSGTRLPYLPPYSSVVGAGGSLPTAPENRGSSMQQSRQDRSEVCVRNLFEENAASAFPPQGRCLYSVPSYSNLPPNPSDRGSTPPPEYKLECEGEHIELGEQVPPPAYESLQVENSENITAAAA